MGAVTPVGAGAAAFGPDQWSGNPTDAFPPHPETRRSSASAKAFSSSRLEVDCGPEAGEPAVDLLLGGQPDETQVTTRRGRHRRHEALPVLLVLVHDQQMIDLSGSHAHRFRSGSRLPFHSSSRETIRLSVRRTRRRTTIERGRSSQTTVSARCHTGPSYTTVR